MVYTQLTLANNTIPSISLTKQQELMLIKLNDINLSKLLYQNLVNILKSYTSDGIQIYRFKVISLV